MNKLEGFYQIEKLKIKHPNWTIIRMDLAEPIIKNLKDNIYYTVRTAVAQSSEKKNDFWLPRMVGVTGKKVKEEFIKFKEHFDELEEETYIIIYPYFKAVFSGIIHLIFESNPINSTKTIIVEACDGSLWNLTEHGLKNYEARVVMSNTNEIMSEKSDIPHWQELRGEIKDIVKKISSEVKIIGRTEIRIEWSFTDQSFIFYEMRTI